MIAAAPAPATAETATPASALPGTAAGTTPAGFDAILLLQGLAATADTLDAATFEAADTSDALSGGDDEDDSGDDLEDSLAFLANLIATTAPRSSTGDFAAGAGEGGSSGEQAPALPLAANDADGAFSLAAGDAKSDALLALTALTEPLETSQSAGDASQSLNRAAELLAQAQRPAAAEAARPSVLTHARDPRWADDFSARVSLVVRAGESTASLQLMPVDLGPVEVNVTVKDSQATIHFGAAQAETRSLIEASLPKLRELLASQGFNLMDASVSSGFSRQQQAAFAAGRGGVHDEAETSTTEARVTRQLGLLDLYA